MIQTGVWPVGTRRQAARNGCTARASHSEVRGDEWPSPAMIASGQSMDRGGTRRDPGPEETGTGRRPVSAPPVADWMHSPVHSVTPSTRTADAVALLRQHRIRHLPVMDGDRVVGVVTDRDLRGVESD